MVLHLLNTRLINLKTYYSELRGSKYQTQLPHTFLQHRPCRQKPGILTHLSPFDPLVWKALGDMVTYM